LPEGYDDNDFDERKKIPEKVPEIVSKEVPKDEAPEAETPPASENQENLE
jgi:hypothetical protein